jgi:ABC-2 type transport system permease protein
MYAFIAFVRKEFMHILRDRKTLLFIFGLPIAQILLFGFALSTEIKNSKIGILDQSRDAASRQLIERIAASNYFSVEAYLEEADQIQSFFRQGKIKMVWIIPPDFEQDLLQQKQAQLMLITDGSDTNTANTITNYAQAIIQDFQSERFAEGTLPYRIEVETRMLYNPQLKSAYSFVPGVMAMIMMLLSSLMTAVAIVREKETGTMEILLASPLKPWIIIIGKAIPYLVLAFINLLLILGLSIGVLDMPVRGSLALLLLECLLFILTSLALGLFISSITSSQQVAMFISLVGLLLPTVMFSGFMFPIENMPLPLQGMTYFIPARWFYEIVSAIMVKGLGVDHIWKQSLILLLMAAGLILISIRTFKTRLE